MSHRALFFAVACSLSLVACGDDTTEGKPTCELLGETCHESTTDAGQECHEFGEDPASTEDECLAKKDDCLAECQ